MPCSSGNHETELALAKKFWEEERDREAQEGKDLARAEKPKKKPKKKKPKRLARRETASGDAPADQSREEELAELQSLVTASGLQSLLSSDLDVLTRLTCKWIREHGGEPPAPLRAWWSRHKLWDERRQKSVLDAFVGGAPIRDIDADDLREAVKALVK